MVMGPLGVHCAVRGEGFRGGGCLQGNCFWEGAGRGEEYGLLCGLAHR